MSLPNDLMPCIALLSDPEMTHEVREVFFAVIAATSSDEAADELRRLVYFFLNDGPEPPVDLDPPPEPRSPWED